MMRKGWMFIFFSSLVTVWNVYFISHNGGLFVHLKFVRVGSEQYRNWFHSNAMGILNWTKTATTIASKENKHSVHFIYSETAIAEYATAIHKLKKTYVVNGSEQCLQRLPQCIIIGNYKCGTRELIDFMSMHPRIKILSKPIYEVEFFTKLYSRGLDWYRRQMPCSYSNEVTVVKMPSYFQSESTPQRINKMNSSIKLIAMFREPVSRMISHFTFQKHGLPYNLELAVIDRIGGAVNTNSHYVQYSMYDEGLARYLKLFNRSQIKLYDISEFKRDPYAILFDLENFLNLEHAINPESLVFNNQKGYYCLRKDNKSKTAACYKSDRGRNSSKSREIIKASPVLLDKLQRFFKPHNEKFFKLAGRIFDW